MELPIIKSALEDMDSTSETVDDSNNSVLDQIMKMKQQRQKKLHDFIRENEPESLSISLLKEVQDNVKKKESSKSKKKSEPVQTPIRRSQRISDKAEEKVTVMEPQRIMIERPENDYGPMPGIKVGHHWETRMECSYDGVHRPTVAGIHAGPYGAYSIALSGGYPEDVDEGYTFTYTGSGGRDLKGTAMKPKNLRTAPQTRNQELEGANYSLVKSIETGNPVRVIRGYKSDSVFAPERGYRYDGLYKVVKYWEDFGKTGFRIYRFKMVRLDGQEPAPWEKQNKPNGKLFKSSEIENVNPYSCHSDGSNGLKFGESKSPNSTVSFKKNGSLIIDSINNKGELELDNDIKDCYEKLIQSSSFFTDLSNRMKNHTPDASFVGWD